MRDSYYGNLTVANAEQFVERLREMLTGKRYTFITVNASLDNIPDVRVHQQLGGRINTEPGVADNIRLYPVEYLANESAYQNLNVCDTYGVWSLTTGFTYFSFQPRERDRPERVAITLKTGYGTDGIIRWLIYIED